MTDEKIVELYWERSETAIGETDRKYGMNFRSVAFGILQSEEDTKYSFHLSSPILKLLYYGSTISCSSTKTGESGHSLLLLQQSGED